MWRMNIHPYKILRHRSISTSFIHCYSAIWVKTVVELNILYSGFGLMCCFLILIRNFKILTHFPFWQRFDSGRLSPSLWSECHVGLDGRQCTRCNKPYSVIYIRQIQLVLLQATWQSTHRAKGEAPEERQWLFSIPGHHRVIHQPLMVCLDCRLHGYTDVWPRNSNQCVEEGVQWAFIETGRA